MLQALRFGAILIFGLFMIVFGCWSIYGEHKLQASGIKVTGVVTGGLKARDNMVGGTLDYSYHVNGKEYTGAGPVGAAEFDRLHVGDPIEIRYLPGDPSDSRAAVGGGSLFGYGMVAVGLVCVTVGGLCLRFLAFRKR